MQEFPQAFPFRHILQHFASNKGGAALDFGIGVICNAFGVVSAFANFKMELWTVFSHN